LRAHEPAVPRGHASVALAVGVARADVAERLQPRSRIRLPFDPRCRARGGEAAQEEVLLGGGASVDAADGCADAVGRRAAAEREGRVVDAAGDPDHRARRCEGGAAAVSVAKGFTDFEEAGGNGAERETPFEGDRRLRADREHRDRALLERRRVARPLREAPARRGERLTEDGGGVQADGGDRRIVEPAVEQEQGHVRLADRGARRDEHLRDVRREGSPSVLCEPELIDGLDRAEGSGGASVGAHRFHPPVGVHDGVATRVALVGPADDRGDAMLRGQDQVRRQKRPGADAAHRELEDGRRRAGDVRAAHDGARRASFLVTFGGARRDRRDEEDESARARHRRQG
jgi:hypothetical protein